MRSRVQRLELKSGTSPVDADHHDGDACCMTAFGHLYREQFEGRDAFVDGLNEFRDFRVTVTAAAHN